MRIQNFQTLSLIVVVTAAWSTNASADTDFRGIPFVQGDNVISDGKAMEGRPWFMDVEDTFSGSGGLDGRVADTRQVGFVPPLLTDPDNGNGPIADGFLSGTLEQLHGVWVGTGDYLVSGGKVALDGGTTVGGVAYQPWRVHEMGDDYLVEAFATLSDNNSTARIGFTGDPSASSSDLMDGEFGQVALEISRTSETAGTYRVTWDSANSSGIGSDSGVVDLPGSATELRMQLAWNDITNTFDAWLDNTPLGGITALGEPEEVVVHGTGLQLLGGASISNFRNAVPEPTSFALLLIGLVGTLSYRKRN